MKTGYKQTEIGVIPEDWEVKTLAQFGEITSSKRIFESDYVSDGIPFYRGKEISLLIENKGLDDEYFISRRKYEDIKREFGAPQKNEILVTAVGTLGNVYLIPDDEPFYFKDGNLIWLRKIKHIDFKYFAIQIENYKNEIINNAIGSSQKALTIVVLKNQSIPIPPKQEQTAIAAALSDVDALMGELDKLIAKKRDIKQATMQQLLTGKKRLAGFSGEWEIKRLGELASIQRGASPRPIENPIWFDDNSSVGWVRISDVTKSGIFLEETTQKLSSLGVQNSRPVACGNLIMSICATVGRPIITAIDVCIHDGFVVFDNLRTDKHFLYYALKFIENDWSKHGQTGSQMNLNTTLINSTKIAVPPQEEQTAIATILSDMDAEISQLEARRTKTSQLKQGMMQELLTGRIRLVGASA
jgi:type I restriction enzyme S subunit